jgi:hypothetical protein
MHKIYRPYKKAIICTSALFLISASVNSCYGYSQDYRIGYVSCIVNDFITEEKFEISIVDEELVITFFERELDNSTKNKLHKRLADTKLFPNVQIVFLSSDKVSPSNGGNVVKSHESLAKLELLPAGVIYNSPIADPKWPKFSVGYQQHLKNVYGKNIFNLSFGENLALLRYKTEGLTYELGIQAGLTGLMDIGSTPTRLINSDYFVGLGVSVVYDRRWQNLIQVSHQSCHLGDEFLISKPSYLKKRINLSHEEVKWYTAYKFDSFRPYIGFGYLFDRDPADTKPFSLEAGLDYISDGKFMFDTTRFVFGCHTHFWDENKMRPTINVRTGLQLKNPTWGGRNVNFLLDYAHGNSRQGQFYPNKEQYIGFLITVAN